MQQLWLDRNLVKTELDMIFSKTLCSKVDFSFCAVEGEQIVEFIAGAILNNYYHAGRVCYISALVVGNGCRGQHIGTDLMERVKVFVLQKNCNSIDLDANFHRQQTHLFYKNYGFIKRAFTFSLDTTNRINL